jgi:DNA-binding response OmpR family regulator
VKGAAYDPKGLDLARVLLARPGTLVSRAELLGALCPGVEVDDRRLLDTLARRVHRRISPLGLAVHTVRGSGLLLQLGDLPA